MLFCYDFEFENLRFPILELFMIYLPFVIFYYLLDFSLIFNLFNNDISVNIYFK